MPEPKQINFTIVPSDAPEAPRIYANFCAIAHTPFDFTLTFCEVLPLSDQDVREAESEHTVHAPVRASIVVPLAIVPNLDGRAAGAHAGVRRAEPGRGVGQGPGALKAG